MGTKSGFWNRERGRTVIAGEELLFQIAVIRETRAISIGTPKADVVDNYC